MKLYKPIISLFLLLVITGCVSNSTYKTAAKSATMAVLLAGINSAVRPNPNKYNNQGIMPVKCNQQRHSGGIGGGAFSVNLGQTSGSFDINYTTYKVSDALQVEYEGRVIANIGCVSTGGTKERPVWNTKRVNYKGRSTNVVVRVRGNCSGSSDGRSTEWAFRVGCPRRQVCDFSLARRCVGASGKGCSGNGRATRDKKRCLIRLLVTPGSQAHDACCAKYPNGHWCWGQGPSWQRSHCRKEWDQAYHDVVWYPFSKHRFCWYGP